MLKYVTVEPNKRRKMDSTRPPGGAGTEGASGEGPSSHCHQDLPAASSEEKGADIQQVIDIVDEIMKKYQAKLHKTVFLVACLVLTFMAPLKGPAGDASWYGV